MNTKLIITIAAEDPALIETLKIALPHAVIEDYSDKKPLGDLVIIDNSAKKAPPKSGNPTIILASPGEKAEAGKELCITLIKPVRLYELLAGIRTLLARAERLRHREIMLSSSIQFLPVEKLVKDIDKKQSISLTEKETNILYALFQSALSREALLEKIWGYGEQITTHTLETHIYRLRGKLKPLLGDKNGIATTESGYLIDF